MKRSWQVWLFYAVCLAVALPALVWLTLAALGAERAERATRHQARREEKIRLSSWRIDTMLMPIITPEVARSYDDYGPLTAPPASKYVLSYFELSPQGAAFSRPTARPNAAESDERLARLRKRLDYG